MDQGTASVLSAAIIAGCTLIGIVVGAIGTYIFTRRGDKKKRARASIEELFTFSQQVRIWFYVTMRRMHKKIDGMDYYRVHMPAEYLEDDSKEPDCPIDRLKMLVALDVPSLKKHLPEYEFIVLQLREMKYIFDKHSSKSTLDYYIGGVVFAEITKMSGRDISSIEEFLAYAEPNFRKRHNEMETVLSKKGRKS